MPITEFKVQSPTTDQQMQAKKVGYLNQRCNPAVELKNNNDTVSQTSPTDPRAPFRAILSVCSQELIDRGNEICSCFAATSTAAPELTFSAGDQSKPPKGRRAGQNHNQGRSVGHTHTSVAKHAHTQLGADALRLRCHRFHMTLNATNSVAQIKVPKTKTKQT